jgi:cob(I)alamin adenosyltransferase
MMAGIIQARIRLARADCAVIKLDKIYTKAGDGGQSGLVDGSRRSKADRRFAAIGAVDETNSALGVARLEAAPEADAMLARIQNDLFDLGADLSTLEEGRKAPGALRIAAPQTLRLESEIDAMNEGLAPLTSFILPGGTRLAAQLHLARAIARRAERQMVALAAQEPLNPEALRYINRLSDHLFVLARVANAQTGDVLWKPGENR